MPKAENLLLQISDRKPHSRHLWSARILWEA